MVQEFEVGATFIGDVVFDSLSTFILGGPFDLPTPVIVVVIFDVVVVANNEVGLSSLLFAT